MIEVREALGPGRRQWLAKLVEAWGDPIIAGGEAYRLDECTLFVAGRGEGLAAIDRRSAPIAELVAINAFVARQGIGTALIEHVSAELRAGGFRQLRLTTTNDNLDALRFYQRRGFRLTALRPGAVDEARRRKPSIPLVGDHGVPIRDEIDLVRDL
ncbi:MAG TPA: GNAT family N-acetyltransferase [Caulobacteraceae bacterium]